jgi:hypothetical protein
MVVDARRGVTETLRTPWVTVMVAEPDFVVSLIDVAVSVTMAGLGTFAGAE